MSRMKSIVTASILIGALGLASSTMACTQAPPSPPTIHIVQVGPTTFCIWICNYTTFAPTPPNTFCACALNKLGVIASVKGVDVFYSVPGMGIPDPCNSESQLTPVPEWVFNADPDVGASYAAFAGTGNWEGLLAQTTGLINQNRPITIKFTINVMPGVTQGQLVGAIDASDPPFIGTGESDASGAILGGHAAVRAAGMIGFAIPALGIIGLSTLGLGMAGAGVFIARRRAAAV